MGAMQLLLLLLILINNDCTAAFCPERCQCNDTVLEAVCVDADLDVMPNALNPALKRIVYRGNTFTNVDVSLRFLPKLEFADLSDNGLLSLDEGAFASQKRLLTLKLDNNKISVVTNRTFEGLERLQMLSLRGNFIEELPQHAFAAAAETLTELNLGQNRIKTIHPKAFEGLKNLKRLHLDNNKLHSAPYVALSLLPNLSDLTLASNPLKSLMSSSFPRALHRLDLSSCGLQSLSSLSLTNLRWLRLDNNLFRNLPELSSLSSLESLHLARNPIFRLPANAFQGQLSRLRHLSLKDCDLLIEVESHAFAHLPRLERLELSHNDRLSNLPNSDLFEVLPQLRRLDLSHNELKTLSYRAANWKVLEDLRLEGNSWHCDCNLAFLADLNVSDSGKAKCATPDHLRSWSIFSQATIQRDGCQDNEFDNETSSMGANQPHRMDESNDDNIGSDRTLSVILLLLATVVVIASLLGLILLLVRCRRTQQMQKNNKPWKASAPHVHSPMMGSGFNSCPNYLLDPSAISSSRSPPTTTSTLTNQQQQYFFDDQAPPLPPRHYSASTSSSIYNASSSEENEDDLRFCDPHVLVEQRRRQAFFKGQTLPVTEL